MPTACRSHHRRLQRVCCCCFCCGCPTWLFLYSLLLLLSLLFLLLFTHPAAGLTPPPSLSASPSARSSYAGDLSSKLEQVTILGSHSPSTVFSLFIVLNDAFLTLKGAEEKSEIAASLKRKQVETITKALTNASSLWLTLPVSRRMCRTRCHNNSKHEPWRYQAASLLRHCKVLSPCVCLSRLIHLSKASKREQGVGSGSREEDDKAVQVWDIPDAVVDVVRDFEKQLKDTLKAGAKQVATVLKAKVI
jgi:hypothetical protein